MATTDSATKCNCQHVPAYKSTVTYKGAKYQVLQVVHWRRWGCAVRVLRNSRSAWIRLGDCSAVRVRP